jgi:hypothetical protein
MPSSLHNYHLVVSSIAIVDVWMCGCVWEDGGKVCCVVVVVPKGRKNGRADVLNMADMAPKQGFTCCLSGRLILRRETDWRRMGFSCVGEPLGGMVADWWREGWV